MSKSVKKGLIIAGAVIAVVIALMILIPFMFKGKIKEAVVAMANENLDAEVVIGDFGLNLFSNFPNATLSLNDASIVGIGAFESDTLLKAKKASVTIDLSSLFGDNYTINKIDLDQTSIYAKVAEDGKVNWDIVKTDSTVVASEASGEDSAFNLALNNIIVNSCNITYEDFESNIKAYILGWNGKINGDFSANETTLKTKSVIDELTIMMDGIPYLSKVRAVADAEIKANFDQMKFTFIDSHCLLNDLAASVDGSFALLEEGFDFDLKLKAPDATFKQILSLVPAMYNDDFKDIKTEGDVTLSAYIMGEMTEKNFPALDLRLTVSDGMFQYPSLPKAVEDINLILSVNGEGGSLDNIMVLVDKFSFTLGGNPFKGNFRMTPAVNDRSIKFNAEGKLDLGIIKDVYPLGEGVELNGLVDANIKIATTESAIEKEQYENISADGFIKLTKMIYRSEGMPDVSINNAALEFTSRYANLSNLDVLIGQSDIKATGRLENFIAYALKDQTLRGNLNIKSKFLDLDQLMGDDAAEETAVVEENSETTIIPKNIDFVLNANLAHVIFSKIDIANLAGAITVKNGILSMNNVGASSLGGLINVSGAYNTSEPKDPKVDFDLALTRVSFAETFKHIEAVQKFAPIFEDVTGTYSMNFKFDTKLGDNMDQTLAALSGSGALQTSDLKLEGNKTLAALGSALKTDKLNNIAPKDLNLPFTIKDGAMITEPFDVNLGDGAQMTLSGVTKLDQTIDFKGDFKLPTSMDNKFISKIPLTITGNFSKPKIGVDMKAAATDVIGNTVGKLLGGDKDGKAGAVGDAVNKLLGGKGTAATKEEQIEKLRTDAESNGAKLVEAAEKAAEKIEKGAGSNAFAKAAAKKLAQETVKKAEKEAEKLKAGAEEKIKVLEATEE